MSVSLGQVHVARQPILDAKQQVFGYELLYRAGPDDEACTATANVSARVIRDAFQSIGFDTLTDGRKAFINLDAPTLLADGGGLFEPSAVVVELLETIAVTPEVTGMCQSLRDRGYAIALDDFVPGGPAEALVPLASFVKLDVRALDERTFKSAAERLVSAGITIVAEKVETDDVLTTAKAAGCALFQGYFFCRPVTFSGRGLPTNHVAQMQLVASLNRPSVSLASIEDLLKRDGALSYRVLRSVNSAAFGLRREVRSIREALLLLGLGQVRKWSSIWVLAGMNRGPAEVVTMTVIRARFCELLGRRMGRPDQGAGYFLLGLCSLLDVLLGHPLPEAIKELPLDTEIRDALLGEPNKARMVLDTVVDYQQGYWHRAAQAAMTLGIDAIALPDAYAETLVWAHAVSRATP